MVEHGSQLASSRWSLTQLLGLFDGICSAASIDLPRIASVQFIPVQQNKTRRQDAEDMLIL